MRPSDPFVEPADPRGQRARAEHPSWVARHAPDGEPFPDLACRAEGWAYEDFMWQVFSREEFSALLEALGADSYRMIALTICGAGGWVRGQMAVAPVAIPVLEAWKATHPGRNLLSGDSGRSLA